MAIEVETKDCTALSDAELAEMADICADGPSRFEAGQQREMAPGVTGQSGRRPACSQSCVASGVIRPNSSHRARILDSEATTRSRCAGLFVKASSITSGGMP